MQVIASYVLQRAKMPVPLTKRLKTAVVIQGLQIWSRFKVGQVAGSLVVWLTVLHVTFCRACTHTFIHAYTYLCIYLTVLGVVKIRTVGHYHAQIYIVTIKLLKGD